MTMISRTAAAAIALVLGAVALGSTWPGMVNAQERTAAPKDKGRSSVADLNAARRLFAFGQTNKDVFAMIAAARVASRYASKPGDSIKPAAGATAGAGAGLTADAMFDAAIGTAGKDPELLAAIESARKASTRSQAARAVNTLDGTIASKAEASYTWAVAQGQWIDIGLAGRGGIDIDLYVMNPEGRQICASENDGDQEYCTFYSHKAGDYQVFVVNSGETETAFQFYWPS